MSIETFIDKYKKQFKAMAPDYDVPFDYSKETPVEFQNPEGVKLTFACIADTHLIDKESATANLENFFTDVFSAKKPFDAVMLAGDIAEYGKKAEYRRFFDVFDKYQKKIKIFLTMGNHDVRVFFKNSRKRVMEKVDKYLGIETKGKTYYSYDIKGYAFIVICTERRLLEKASLTKEQIDFLDKELARATKDGKPVFVMCHQAFKNTHGLPEVWKTGDMGEESDEVRAVMEKYKNVFFINGHLHGGIFEKTLEVLKEENNVYSLSVPGYRKENNFGIKDCGTGYYAEVYDDRVVFTARKFISGEYLEGDYTKFEIKLI